MTDEDYLELARASGAHEVSDIGQYVAMIGEYCFTQTELLAYTREIERRVLEREKMNQQKAHCPAPKWNRHD